MCHLKSLTQPSCTCAKDAPQFPAAAAPKRMSGRDRLLLLGTRLSNGVNARELRKTSIPTLSANSRQSEAVRLLSLREWGGQGLEAMWESRSPCLQMQIGHEKRYLHGNEVFEGPGFKKATQLQYSHESSTCFLVHPAVQSDSTQTFSQKA